VDVAALPSAVAVLAQRAQLTNHAEMITQAHAATDDLVTRILAEPLGTGWSTNRTECPAVGDCPRRRAGRSVKSIWARIGDLRSSHAAG
jgi:hypothetical protein